MRAFPLAIALSCLLMSTIGQAAEPFDGEFVEVPPPPPPAMVFEDDEDQGDAGTEPEVTIIQREDALYEEYRVNGRLYMVKVEPVVGPAYFFLDNDGDGLLETRWNTRTRQPRVPQWVLFSW